MFSTVSLKLAQKLQRRCCFKHIQWKPSCEATPFAFKMWPFKRGGLSSEVEINTFLFRFTLSSGLFRGTVWPLKRGSTVAIYSQQYIYSEFNLVKINRVDQGHLYV